MLKVLALLDACVLTTPPFPGGPWTPAVIPEAHKTVEATMGTVMFIDVPEHRQDLRQKFHPDNMPIWRFLQGEGDK